jgi:hypothetical protein
MNHDLLDNRKCDKNYVTLKEYLEARLEAINLASKKNDDAVNVRLEHMNEFRKQIQDERSFFLTKDHYENCHQYLENKIDSLTKLVYIGLGLVIAFEFIFKFFMQ